ncbi:MAG: hypothetical protein ACPHOZ_07050, partial [Candidatus Puniceispirillaceae bacterium]
RQAHNLKVAGSNPAPATNKNKHLQDFFRLPLNGSYRAHTAKERHNSRHTCDGSVQDLDNGAGCVTAGRA